MKYNEIFGLSNEYEVTELYSPRYFDLMPKEIPIQNLFNEGLYSNSNAYFIGYTNTSGLDSLNGCFANTTNANVIDMREWDLTNIKSIRNCFSDSNAKVVIFGDHPESDKLNDMYWCFWGTDFRKIDFRGLDTSKVRDYSYSFASCYYLTELYGLDFSSANSLSNVFAYGEGTLIHTDGFKGLRHSWDDTEGLARCPYLSKQSCLNIIDGLYDFTANGETPNSDEGVLKVHENFINKLTEDELQVATNKNWSIIY